MTRTLFVACALASTVFSQQPNLGDPSEAVLLDVALTLTGSDGEPWPSEVTVIARYPEIGFKSYIRVTPGVQGQANVVLGVDKNLAENGAPVHIEVWSDGWAGLIDPSSRCFLSPNDGMAAFPGSSIPTWVDAVGRYAVTVLCSMSAPPVYGDLVVSNPTGQTARLVVQDHSSFAPDTWSRSIPEFAMHLVGPGSSYLTLYRWSAVAATRVALLGPKGSVVGSGLLRRSGVLPITVVRENLMTLQVDRSSFTGDYVLLVIPPEFHEPDPSVPTGSAVVFDLQSTRARSTVRCRPGASLFARGFYLAADDRVVELWSRGTSPQGHIVYTLVSAQAVNSTTIDPVVIFD